MLTLMSYHFSHFKIESCDLEDMVDFWYKLKSRRRRVKVAPIRLYLHHPTTTLVSDLF
jgi:hypothetical protein